MACLEVVGSLLGWMPTDIGAWSNIDLVKIGTKDGVGPAYQLVHLVVRGCLQEHLARFLGLTLAVFWP